MRFMKIASGLRIESDASGGYMAYNIETGGGGSKVKDVQYHVVIKQLSGITVRLYAKLQHGPDDKHYTDHSDVIGTLAAPEAVPTEELLVGDADTSIILGEFLQLVLNIKDSASTNPVWAVVDVYEMRKAV